ncbi:MAG TPA: BamA/TamA family outer membrane protein, partial [Longimicrobium sp.]|nr:BamA/TamA family outer membrane protein [Longimicrobium sp.]
MLAAALLVLALQDPAAASTRPAAPADTTAAYLDPAARQIVQGARERRARVERTIGAYQATVRQRIYAGVSALRRDRTMFGQEMAVRVHWRRNEPGVVSVLGARQATPIASGGVEVPDDLEQDAPDLAFDPDELQMDLFSFGIRIDTDPDSADDERGGAEVRAGRRDRGDGDEDEDGDGDRSRMKDPLAEGSEAHYRFQSGETTSIRMPDGQTIRLMELKVLPRRHEFWLVRGSLWVDASTYGVVRTVFATARPFSLRRDTDEKMPAFLRVLGDIGAEVRYVTVEYALSQGRYWMPRLMAVDMRGQMGIFAGMPVRFERSYADYEVSELTSEQRVALLDTAARADTRPCDDKQPGYVCECEDGRCQVWKVEIPVDTTAMLSSPDLPPPLATGGQRLITGEEVESLARYTIPGIGRMFGLLPTVDFHVLDLESFRYNRVEGLGIGAGAEVDYRALKLDAQAWVGTADREPKAEIGVSRETASGARVRLAGYRRLAPFDPTVSTLNLSSSLSALFLGRDEADYFLASGAELTAVPVRSGTWSYAWRLFGEHQHGVSKNTDVSLVGLWDDDVFPEVRGAQRADQMGASLSLRTDHGIDPMRFRWSAGVTLDGQTGTFGFARPSGFARIGIPLGAVVTSLEAAAGTSTGDVPVQGMWYLGGPQSVRGYPVALLGGSAFWRARGEVATPTPAARLTLFMDAGWVGSRDAFQTDPLLLSAGVGASLMDGLIRLDLARAL